MKPSPPESGNTSPTAPGIPHTTSPAPPPEPSTTSNNPGSIYTCPISGLPILHKPEWHQISFGELYRLSIDLLGEQIILTHSQGPATPRSAQYAMRFMTEIIDEFFPDQHYIQIFDYCGVNANYSLTARRILIRELKKRKRMLAAIFYGAETMLRLSIEFARFFHRFPFSILIARDYSEALKLASEILDNQKQGTQLLAARNQALEQQTCQLLKNLDHPSPDISPDTEPIVQHSQTLIEDEFDSLEQLKEHRRNLETLLRLEKIIRSRNEKARLFQNHGRNPETL